MALVDLYRSFCSYFVQSSSLFSALYRFLSLIFIKRSQNLKQLHSMRTYTCLSHKYTRNNSLSHNMHLHTLTLTNWMGVGQRGVLDLVGLTRAFVNSPKVVVMYIFPGCKGGFPHVYISHRQVQGWGYPCIYCILDYSSSRVNLCIYVCIVQFYVCLRLNVV